MALYFQLRYISEFLLKNVKIEHQTEISVNQKKLLMK